MMFVIQDRNVKPYTLKCTPLMLYYSTKKWQQEKAERCHIEVNCAKNPSTRVKFDVEAGSEAKARLGGRC